MIEIGYEIRNRIAYITLNRPAAKNAVTPTMHEELCRIWADFGKNDEADVPKVLTPIYACVLRPCRERSITRPTSSGRPTGNEKA